MRVQAVMYVIQVAVNVNVLKQTGVRKIYIIFYKKYKFSYFLPLITKEMKLNLIFCFARTLTEIRKTGDNMQLICVSSVENASKVPRYCDASCQADCESLTEFSDLETKVKEGKLMADSLNNIKLVVFEETEINFLKYRREYQRLMQSIPMYSSNTQNKPWDIVAWISDKLVDELIMEIAKELQIDDVIQKLFELEFQEF